MKHKLALVTGASSGIGASFARELAAKNHDLFITARRLDRLESLKKEIEETFNVQVHAFNADLLNPDGVKELLEELSKQKMNVDILINNAGFGARVSILDKQPADWDNIIRVNVNSLVALTLGILPSMVERQSGKILNVSSTGAFQAVPWLTIYAATKSFILSFSEGLAAELKDQNINVQVTCLCPGPTRTEFHSLAEADDIGFPDFAWMESDQVVKAGLNALERSKSVCIPGTYNKLNIHAQRFVPRSIITNIVGDMHKPKNVLTKNNKN